MQRREEATAAPSRPPSATAPPMDACSQGCEGAGRGLHS